MEKYKFIISTDSGCDLSKEMCEQYGIIPIMMNYLDEDIIYKDTMEKSDIIAFYKQMEEGKVFKTSAININEAYEFLKELIKYNKPVIHISLGSGISGTYNNFLNAKEMIKEKYPDSVIEIIDSTSASLGYGMMCIEAAKLRDEGKTYEEIIRYVENIKRGVNPYFETSTLTYLARGGRVTKIASIFGNVLSIRPVLRLDYDGHLVVYTKGHGKLNTFKKVIEAVKEAVIDPQNQTLYVSHSNAINDAVELAEKIKEEIGFKDIVYSYIGTIIGSHTGPGLVSVFFHGKDRFK